jgi:hypothetical protein
VWSILLSQCNKDDTITETYPDGSTLAYYGWLKSAKPQSKKEGEFPKLTVEIVPSNWDATNNVEEKEVFTPAGGT